MKQIVTAFFMMFLLLIQIGISNGIIFADTQVTTAERYHQNIIAEIEAGNLSDAVIDTCKAKATADRYVLQTDKIVDSTGKTVAVEVILKYKYKIAFLNVEDEHQKCGYAR